VAYNFQNRKNSIKLFTQYESVIKNVLFGDAVLAELMSGRRYDVISQNCDYLRQSNVRTLVFRNKVHYQNAASLQNSIWKRSTFRICYPTLGKAISRDWLCSAPKTSRKILIKSRKLGHITCHERRISWSCLAFCSIDSRSNKTYWVTLSYFFNSFFFCYFQFKNYRPRKHRQ
jgi:hypothetical protein